MQFRAGILYTVLFVVTAAGAYGVIATASPPTVTGDNVGSDYELQEGDEFEVNGQVFNLTSVTSDTATAEYVNESAVLEVQWDDDAGVAVAEGEEYTLNISTGTQSAGNDSSNETTNESGASTGNESGDTATNESGEGPNSFGLIENYDEGEYQVEPFENQNDRLYVITEEDDERTAVPIEEFEEIDTQVYEQGDAIEFYEGDSGQMVEGEVMSISDESVTVEYEGEEVTETELSHADTATMNDQEFAVYVNNGTVSLSSDIGALEAQQTDREEFNQRVSGLWWVVVLSILAMVITAGLAFMPVRG